MGRLYLQKITTKLKSGLKKSIFYKIFSFIRALKEQNRWKKSDQSMLDFYGQFIKAGDLCFDVGANIGNRTKIFLALDAKVIAVEPQKDCSFFLKYYFRNNKSVEIIPKALGGKEGKADLYISDGNTVSSMSPEWINRVKQTGRFGNNQWSSTVQVQVTTLDELISKYGLPVFIKIDVEGYEYEVISGLSQSVRFISMEFTPEYFENSVKVLEHLSLLGSYEVNFVIGESFKFYLDDWTQSDRMIEILRGFKNKHKLWGDLYIHFLNK